MLPALLISRLTAVAARTHFVCLKLTCRFSSHDKHLKERLYYLSVSIIMKKHILIFGAGKSATSVIDYLKQQLEANSWTLTVADSNLHLAAAKTAEAPGTRAVELDVKNDDHRRTLI